MISLILIFGFLCQSSIFRYLNDRDIKYSNVLHDSRCWPTKPTHRFKGTRLFEGTPAVEWKEQKVHRWREPSIQDFWNSVNSQFTHYSITIKTIHSTLRKLMALAVTILSLILLTCVSNTIKWYYRHRLKGKKLTVLTCLAQAIYSSIFCPFTDITRLHCH